LPYKGALAIRPKVRTFYLQKRIYNQRNDLTLASETSPAYSCNFVSILQSGGGKHLKKYNSIIELTKLEIISTISKEMTGATKIVKKNQKIKLKKKKKKQKGGEGGKKRGGNREGREPSSPHIFSLLI
jgi:hypothetical protein